MRRREVRNELLSQEIILEVVKGNEKAVYKVVRYYEKKNITHLYTSLEKRELIFPICRWQIWNKR